jgi:hypothetical protein
MNNELERWLLHGDRGTSSNAMVEVFENYPKGLLIGAFGARFPTHPHDPSDFNRCYELLEAVPGYREQLYKMSSKSAEWETLVEHWSELEEMLLEERKTGSSPKLYKRMQELFEIAKGEVVE